MESSPGAFARFWLPVLLYAGAIFVLSSYALPFPPGLEVRFLDSVLHVLEYGVLGYLLARAFLHAGGPFFRRAFQAWAASVAIFYGFTDEIHQLFVPMRQASALDLLFDGVGALAAQLFFIRRTP